AEAALVEHRQVRRRQLADLAQDAGGGGNVLAREVLDQGFRIQLPWDAPMGEERLELRAKDDARAADEVVERLLAQPVSRQDQLAPARIPDRQREHAVHALGEVLSPF